MTLPKILLSLLFMLSGFLCISQENKVAGRLSYNLNMVHHNPGEPPFETKYNDPAFLKLSGFNGQVPRVHLPCAICYDQFDSTIVPRNSTIRNEIDRYASELDRMFKKAEEVGMPVYPFTDVLVLPKTAIEKYGKEMRADESEKGTEVLGGTRFNSSILKSRTQELLRAQVDAIFSRFPTIGGLVVRFGETYLHEFPGYAGGSPAKSVEEHITLISILREEICVKRNKKLFFRTWDFGTFHTKPEYYLNVTNAVDPHPNLIFSIKHVQNDFIRLYPFNPCLGIGKHQQIVEVSVNQAGLYGKNAHPYYIAKGVINGWDEFGWFDIRPKSLSDLVVSPLLAGIWTWSRGDGWAGPYISNELWVDINVQTLTRYGNNPKQSEDEIFAQVVAERLKITGKDLQKIRQICLLSATGTLFGQASMYAHISDWWCRDEYIAAVDLSPIVAAGKVQEAIEEKQKAVGIWKKIEKLSAELYLPNKEDQEFLRVSCTYGRIKYQIFEQVWKMQLLAAEAAIYKRGINKQALKKAIQTYETSWVEWRKLKSENTSCPTLYRDDQATFINLTPFRAVLDKYKKLVNF